LRASDVDAALARVRERVGPVPLDRLIRQTLIELNPAGR